jgi:hypothetical protein
MENPGRDAEPAFLVKLQSKIAGRATHVGQRLDSQEN